jgi:hypothetical protein
VGLPLLSDDVIEFHAARLLLLFNYCGVSGRIDGLTKMAKLDFFARYPEFFEVARRAEQMHGAVSERNDSASVEPVEAAMVRHHYGPWDKRYYHILALLEANELLTITKYRNSYQLCLTSEGKIRARDLSNKPSFAPIVQRMREVKNVFGSKSGSALKNLIYRLFNEEVGKRPLGEVIKP